MVFSKFPEKCNRPGDFGIFSLLQKETPYSLAITPHTPISLAPQPQATTHLPPVFYRFVYSGHFT